ncbi:MAG: glycosyltransferase family 2 protein [Lentisphaerae bacterium]|nr:glycosyltransferase family 2 protein [Lentisphaerota bacterium]
MKESIFVSGVSDYELTSPMPDAPVSALDKDEFAEIPEVIPDLAEINTTVTVNQDALLNDDFCVSAGERGEIAYNRFVKPPTNVTIRFRLPETIKDEVDEHFAPLHRNKRNRVLPRQSRCTQKQADTFVYLRRKTIPLLREKLETLQELKACREGKEYLLTILLTTYNHGNSIAKCLDSILSQETTYPYIIRILDDCSTDKTSAVCAQYAEQYPDRIDYCPEPINSAAINITAHMRKIKTKYFTVIDGDDFWCCDNKIQKSLDFLESHPEYAAYTHDARFRDLVKHKVQSYTHDIIKVRHPQNTFTFENYFYTHVSTRIHRNVVDWEKEYPDVRMRDIYVFYLTLDKGPFYYDDTIMSEYTFSGSGAWSKQSFTEVQYSYNYRRYIINRYTNYRHDKVLRQATNSRLLNLMVLFMGKKLGWKFYTKYRRKKLIRNVAKFVTKEFNGKLDFIEYKHEDYPAPERIVRDEVFGDRF